jgi:hypothetical protein
MLENTETGHDLEDCSLPGLSIFTLIKAGIALLGRHKGRG